MKTLVVFYSLTENTAKEAERVAEALGATTLRLYARKAYPDKGFKKFLWGGKSAVMGEQPALVPYTIDLSEYDLVLFGTPVWASTYAPPLRTFITENKEALAGKRFAAFACAGGANPGKTFTKLSETLDEPLSATVLFADAEPDDGKAQKRADFIAALR